MGALSGASFDVSSDCLGKEILMLFAVGALSAASSDLSSDCFGKGDFVAICGFSSFDSRSRQYEIQKVRFKLFLPLAPEVDKMMSRASDLSIFWPWLQKSTK